tara:strand:+ start:8751 stop:13157 length:4407 start_codon:yes stop_codon:yes gene_type:complete
MKKSTLLIVLFLTFSFGFSQTTLTAGQVAITGANANNPDQFSFVLLTDVDPGTVINFTDCGVTAAGAFRNLNLVNGNIAEGVVTWTSPGVILPCGTEIIIEETALGSNVYTATNGTASETDNGFVLAGNGDQLIAFQGTTISPSFLFALHFANGLGWATDATNNQTSAVPTGLTDGTNAVAIEANQNNIIYNYNTLGDNLEILAALVDSSQWILSNPRLELEPPIGASFNCDTSTTYTTTTLMAGEIAITGANADNPDQFSFVLLTDVLIGTKIHFTDGGWTAAGEFRGYNAANGTIQEGIVTWIADRDLDCGTEIIIAETASGSNVYTASIGTASETDNGFALGANGDQIFAFQGTVISPDFIYALHFANATGWVADATDTLTSALPAPLTEGVDAVAINSDNLVYNYNTLGDSTLVLAALVDPTQYIVNNATRQNLGLPGSSSFSCNTIITTTTLMAGEIAITGANADNPDQFSFVLLTDVSNRTQINFTDGGWTAAGEFRGYNAANGAIQEGIVTWTADSDLPCGTEIIIAETAFGSNVYTASIGTASETDAGFALGANGDQIIAFQGTTLNPNFIFALHFANATGWVADATDTLTSALPTGLTEGVNAVSRDRDNLTYTYNVTGNTTLILAAITDPAEWSGNNGTRQPLGRPIETFTCDATILDTGDVAITGANSDATEQFSFVLLEEVNAGTEINFTDGGWLAGGGFRAYNFTNANPSAAIGEGVLKWTADSFLACGTEIVITDTGSDTWSATLADSATLEGVVVESETGFELGGADQIIVFQRTITTPKFLYALHFGNNLGWSADATNGATSTVPAGLTDGIDAVAVDNNLDNIIYNYSVTNNQSLILAALVDPGNWGGDNTTPQTLGRPIGTFSCTTPGDCFDLLSWNGTVWTAIIGSKTFPDISTAVILDADYNTSIDPGFTACSIDIPNTITLTVANDTFIVVQNDITVDGNLIVETRGNFVQNDDGGNVIIDGSGSCTLNKTTPFKYEWYYYTYWGSPVTSETIGNVFPLVASDRRFSYNAANFLDNSPTDDVDDNNDDWEIAAGVDTMIPGVGYAVTAAKTGFVPGPDNISFTGTFNTGDIPVAITFDPANLGIRWNFIANPYPSAVDFVAFHLANSSVLEGVAYFWSQASPPLASYPGNSQLNFNPDDHAVFNVGVGGTDGGGAGVIPNGYVPSAQGFFIPALNIGTATFTNAMRTPDNTSNSQFFKGAGSKKSNPNTSNNPLENRLWVDLTSDNGVFNQILIGYVDNATDDYDGMAYDAPKIVSPGFAAVLYSSIENDDVKYVIQGKDINSINENEVIKLGFSTTIEVDTEYTFSISQLQGDFLTENSIYLNDNLLNIQHNLSDSDYTFTSDVGEFNSRFEIVFNAQSLSTDDIVTDGNTLKIIELYDDQVQFIISNNLTIKSVSIFDLLGRQLYNFEGNTSSETYKLSNLSNTAYIAKVELSNGAVITKKMIKK